MKLIEGVRRDSLGDIVIVSKVATPQGRLAYEKLMWPGIEVGLTGWERAHSQGNITGFESEYAIRYAPSEVNQYYQRLGIERYISELFKEKKNKNTNIWLTTVTATHAGTLRLKEIQYRIDIEQAGCSQPFFEASIMIENKTTSPRITVDAHPRHAFIAL